MKQKYLKLLDDNSKAYIKDLERLAKEHNIKIFFSDKDSVNPLPNFACAGYFDDRVLAVKDDHISEPVLAVALGGYIYPIDWLQIIVHESCHMDQFIQNTKPWQRFSVTESMDALTIVSLWIQRKIELTSPQLRSYISKVRNVELDAEKRAIRKIKKYKLPIDVKKYSKRANAYVWFFNMIKVHRKWFKEAPYDVKEIYEAMPDNFKNNYSVTPKELQELYIKHCL